VTAKLTDPKDCEHPSLFFGAGGRRVICSLCGTTWIAEGEYVQGRQLNENDVRVTTTGVLVKGVDDAGNQ
jgi:hypothetical protein